MAENILALQGITKSFGGLVAVDNVDFALKAGEIHAILGENGAGKSTLMHLIYGLYQPSAGSIQVAGKPQVFKTPRNAIANGIGMVHQHFMLIENLTVAENIALSLSHLRLREGQPLAPRTQGILSRFRFKKSEAVKTTEALAEKFGIAIDAQALVRTLSVGLKQRVEILKALAGNARILILDEPTAVLSPQEVDGFFTILRNLQADNRSILFISHKMNEVLQISDRITVLRRGKKVYLGKTGELTARELAREMLGAEVAEVVREERKAATEKVLQVSGLSVRGSRDELAVSDVSLTTHRGEIVGIAGVDGNGQRELAEAIMGLRKTSDSSIINILGTAPRGTKATRLLGVGYIPEDRQTLGLIPSFSVAENLELSVLHLKQYGFFVWFQEMMSFLRQTSFTPSRLNVARWRGATKTISPTEAVVSCINRNPRKKRKETAARLIDAYDVRPPNAQLAAGALSGGNQQKVVLAREISPEPALLIAVNPTRGLDINAANYVHQNLLAQRDRGKSMLLISTELDEVLTLSDRLYVMSKGKLHEATAHRNDITTLGLLMTGENTVC